MSLPVPVFKITGKKTFATGLLRWRCSGREEDKMVDENCFVISVFQIYSNYGVSLYVSYLAYYSHR